MTTRDSSSSRNTEAPGMRVGDSLHTLNDTACADRLSYSRNLFGNLIEWYKNADAKAQVILSLDGALLAFLTASIFTKRDDFLLIIHAFKAETWLSLLLMCATLLGSIACAIACLWSRLVGREKLDKSINAAKFYKDFDPMSNEGANAIAEIIWFFQFIAQQSVEDFRMRLSHVNGKMELLALSSQIVELSERVLRKHKLVNLGFLLTGFSLLLLLVGGIGYIVRAR